MRIEFVTARSSLPEEFWRLCRGVTGLDEVLTFPGDRNLRVIVEEFDPADGDSGPLSEDPHA